MIEKSLTLFLLVLIFSVKCVIISLPLRGDIMKYYLNSKDEQLRETYITGVYRNEKDGVYEVDYANGDHEYNIMLNDRNGEVINERLEKQVEAGNMERYKLVRKSKVGALVSGFSTVLATGAAYKLSDLYGGDFGPTIIALGVGTIITCAVYEKLRKPVEEIDQYLELQEKREQARDYLTSSSNAWRCFDSNRRYQDIKEMLEDGRDPFSLLEQEAGDGVTLEEVNNMLTASLRDDQIGFEYKKVKK